MLTGLCAAAERGRQSACKQPFWGVHSRPASGAETASHTIRLHVVPLLTVRPQELRSRQGRDETARRDGSTRHVAFKDGS
jgi:hypothetical protein